MSGYRNIMAATPLALLLAAFVTVLALDLTGPVKTTPGPAPRIEAARTGPVPASPAPSPLAAVFAPRKVPGVVQADLDVPLRPQATTPGKGHERPRNPKPLQPSFGNG